MHRFLFAFSLGVVACGGGQSEPITPAPPPESTAPVEPADTPPAEPTEAEEPPPAEEPPAPTSWKDMNHEQRSQHMKTVVKPRMEELFQGWDAKEFTKFGCGTCHGPGIKEGKFDMPNPELPKLHPANGFAKDKKEHPKGTEFMMTQVVPEMAKMLDMQPYDPKTQKGFGCFNCHVEAK